MKEIELITGSDCPLCEEAKELINSTHLNGFNFIEKDIYTSREIYTKYWDIIPVLLIENRDLCWPFSSEDIKEFILI